jgi:nitrite reductase (NADH) small subunit
MIQTIGTASEIPTNGRLFYTIGEERIAILNIDGALYAIQNTCPHQGGPIGEGRIFRRSTTTEAFVSSFREYSPHTKTTEKPAVAVSENDPLTISCPLHGWEFDLTDGTPVFPAKRGMKTYDVWIEDGLIKLDLGHGSDVPETGTVTELKGR